MGSNFNHENTKTNPSIPNGIIVTEDDSEVSASYDHLDNDEENNNNNSLTQTEIKKTISTSRGNKI